MPSAASWHNARVPSPIVEHLTFLYGRSLAPLLEQRIKGLVTAHFPAPGHRQSGPSRSLALTERDALLITYGDQVREPRQPPLRTLAAFLRDHATDLVTGVHVLPFYPYSSDDGFSVIDCTAVDPALGTWDDIRRLGASFQLMFDAVFNHVSARSVWFQGFLNGDPRFRDWFITVDGNPDLSQVVRPRALPLLTEFQTADRGTVKVWTTFSADQVDLNVSNPEVLLALLDVLLLYVSRGARFIRLDAIAYLWKQIGTPCIHLPQTHEVIQLMRALLDEVAPEVLLITETNVPHRDNVSYFGDGQGEAQLVYNFALPPLVLHSLATGSAEALSRWAASLSLPSDGVTFFNFLASHDGIGVNPVRGILADAEVDALVNRATAHGGFISYKQGPDGSKSPYELNINYFDALSDPASSESLEVQVNRFALAHAIMLAMPGLPGIYFHSLFGSRGDRAGAEASGIPRRINRQKLSRSDLDRDLGDPSFVRSRVLARLAGLLRQRGNSPALSPTANWEVIESDPRVFAIRRQAGAGGARVLCLHNVSAEPAQGLAPYEVRWVAD
jgi:sucrose phosphorylase